MLGPEQTPRQQIRDLLTDKLFSARELAQLVGIPERQVEDHLTHILKTVGRDRTKQFLMTPSECLDCGFVFRDRQRLTCPSRCPKCHREGISPPRFEIKVLSV
jgi:predicted Zn-ribbon and HTH transcriptional regulator